MKGQTRGKINKRSDRQKEGQTMNYTRKDRHKEVQTNGKTERMNDRQTVGQE